MPRSPRLPLQGLRRKYVHSFLSVTWHHLGRCNYHSGTRESAAIITVIRHYVRAVIDTNVVN
jgi:hypothetical protein